MPPNDPNPVEEIPSLPDHTKLDPGSASDAVGSPLGSGLVEPGTASSDRPEDGDDDEPGGPRAADDAGADDAAPR